MFQPGVTLQDIQAMSQNTMVDHLGIEYTDLGDNYISAKMPVDHRTVQPLRMLHGGASVVLSETLGSVAANISVDNNKFYCVGLEINANHIRSMKEGDGYVFGTTRPIHLGKTTQIWETRITNADDKLICISRLTVAVMKKKQ
ncbi:MAG TPA: thioesterase [Cytophagales bacterium]|jgi:1,4-dihydroxy-2-naphthoyl-CoA hydrolase|nr:thioesterase [Cytophagales bacterium]